MFLLAIYKPTMQEPMYLHTVRVGPSYRARFYGPPDLRALEIAVRIIPKHGKPWPQMIFKAGFGYPDKLTVFRLRASHVYSIVSYTDGNQNGFHNIWLFDGRRHKLVQAARDVLNLQRDRFPNGRFHEIAGPQYVGGFPKNAGFMVERYSKIDPKRMAVRYGKWTVLPGSRY